MTLVKYNECFICTMDTDGLVQKHQDIGRHSAV